MKKNIRLFIGLIFAIAIFIIISILTKPEKEETQLIPDLTLEKIARILIKPKEKEQVEIEKKADKWYIKDEDKEYLANESIITQILNQLIKAKKTAVASSKTDKFGLYTVEDSDDTITISDSKGNTIASIIVGKLARDYSSSYIRIKGKKEVLLIDRDLKREVRKSPKDYREKRILKYLKDDINKITLITKESKKEKGKDKTIEKIIELQKEQGVWKVKVGEDLKPANPTEIDNILNKISEFMIDDFEEVLTQKECELDTPTKKILFSTLDGKSEQILIGRDLGQDRAFAMIAGKPEIFIISKYKIDFFNKEIKDFIKLEEK